MEGCLRAVLDRHPASVLQAYLDGDLVKPPNGTYGSARELSTSWTHVEASLDVALEPYADLRMRLGQEATRQLRAAEGGECESALLAALALAERLDKHLTEASRTSACRRLKELREDAHRSERRATLGIDTDVIPYPREFVCPITLSRMIDPVVASDGHSYERAAILSVLESGSGRSPLTREELRASVVIPNHALRRRIREYDEELVHVAEAAAEHSRGLSSGPSPHDTPASGGTVTGDGEMATICAPTRASRKRARAASSAHDGGPEASPRSIALTLRGARAAK